MPYLDPHNTLTGFEKGLDFCKFFTARKFSIYDIAERYGVSTRQAWRLKQQAEQHLQIRPAGFTVGPNKGPDRYLWEISKL